MTLLRLTTALTLCLAALPALANPNGAKTTVIAPTLGIMLRDSDGIVISVIHPPIDYIPWSGGIVPGGVFYTLGGVEMGGVEMGSVELATSGVGITTMAHPGGVLGATSGRAATPVVLGGAELAAPSANGTTVSIGGTTYRVESAGGKVWLRDPATGLRYATARHIAPMTPDATGLTINPAAFTLD